MQLRLQQRYSIKVHRGIIRGFQKSEFRVKCRVCRVHRKYLYATLVRRYGVYIYSVIQYLCHVICQQIIQIVFKAELYAQESVNSKCTHSVRSEYPPLKLYKSVQLSGVRAGWNTHIDSDGVGNNDVFFRCLPCSHACHTTLPIPTTRNPKAQEHAIA